MTRAGMALGPHGLAYIAHGARRYLEAKLQQQGEEVYAKPPPPAKTEDKDKEKDKDKKDQRVRDEALERAQEVLKARDVLIKMGT